MTATGFARGERPRPDWIRRHPKAWLAAVGTVCFGAFMGQLDASVVALAYHSIGTGFHARLDQVQLISISYLIALAVLLVPVGRASDRLGRKRVYLWGFALFSVASAGCALAPGLDALIGLRAVQGAGAAMLQANSVALVSTSAPEGQLRRALGMQAAAQAIGLAAGPTIGGLVVQTIGWRWIFALNVPVGVVAIVAGRYLLPRTRLSDEPGRGLREVFGEPSVARGLFGALLAYLLLFGPIVAVPAVMQQHGVAPLAAGLVVAALPVGFALGALVAERLLPPTLTTWWRCMLGAGLAAAGFAGLLAVGMRSPASAGPLLLIGVGLGVFTPANNAAVMSAVSTRVAALTGGLVSTARAIGTAAGTALVSATLAVAAGGWLAATVLLALALVAAASVPRRDAAG